MSLSARLEIVSEQLRKTERAEFSFPSLPPFLLRLVHAKLTVPYSAKTLSPESKKPIIQIPGISGEVQRSVKGAEHQLCPPVKLRV